MTSLSPSLEILLRDLMRLFLVHDSSVKTLMNVVVDTSFFMRKMKQNYVVLHHYMLGVLAYTIKINIKVVTRDKVKNA